MGYTHLTPRERESIQVGRALKQSIRQIAESIGRSPSTVSRELARNTDSQTHYSPSRAQERYRSVRAACHPHRKLIEDKEVLSLIRERLCQDWSPEQIVGREELDISFGTIYRGIHDGLLDGVKEHLRHRGKPYRKRNHQETRGRINDGLSIDKRPQEALERREIGHLELDTVLGKTGTGGLVTVVDRRSGYLWATKIPDKTANSVELALIRLLSGVPCKTLTADNGKEFANHKNVSHTLAVPMYFAHPRSPWERGVNENTNGLIRGYFPKGFDFQKVQNADVEYAVMRLNNRPRKRLGFKTPAEICLWGLQKVLHLN